MSNIDKQELRLTAEKAKDNFMPNFMVPTRDLLALLDALEAAEKRIAELGGHLKIAHAFIENTEAFGYEAASGILKCGDSEWNVDASKESLAAAGITVKGE